MLKEIPRWAQTVKELLEFLYVEHYTQNKFLQSKSIKKLLANINNTQIEGSATHNCSAKLSFIGE